MVDHFTIKIEGLEELRLALLLFAKDVKKNMAAAAKEAAAKQLLPTVGLQKYPPATAANAPPVPYYIRGRGTMTKKGLNATSERLGTQWYVRSIGLGAAIGNRASYAQWVHGEEQATKMGEKGWRKLVDVAQDKIQAIQQVYDRWIKYTIRKCGL